VEKIAEKLKYIPVMQATDRNRAEIMIPYNIEVGMAMAPMM